jgi:UDP-N-acetylmuramoylalanine--D-glutamate ligase
MRSGRAAALLLRRVGVPVYASDAAYTPALRENAAALRKAGCDVELGRHDLERIARSAIVILSPGVPPDAAPVVAARAAGVPVVAELSLGMRFLAATKFIVVTGTKGKSTTAACIAHLLAALGLGDAGAAGNIGLPLTEVALAGKSPKWLAV